MKISRSVQALLFALAAMTITWSCQDAIVEGQHAGDCEDGADNDMDGLFDCSDDGCIGSPVCENSGIGDDDTGQDDDDTSQDDDDTSPQGDDDTSPQGDDDDSQGGGGTGGGQGGSGEGQSQNCQATACPECEDGVDNDNDGMTDCADDSCDQWCGGGGGTGGGGGGDLPACCFDQSCANMSDCGDPPGGDDDDSGQGGGTGGTGGTGGGQGGSGEGQSQNCTDTACPECGDTIDNDNDGLIDCADDSCDQWCGGGS